MRLQERSPWIAFSQKEVTSWERAVLLIITLNIIEVFPSGGVSDSMEVINTGGVFDETPGNKAQLKNQLYGFQKLFSKV